MTLCAVILVVTVVLASTVATDVVHHHKLPRSVVLADSKKQHVVLLELGGARLRGRVAPAGDSMATGAALVQSNVEQALETAQDTLRAKKFGQGMLETELLANGEELHVLAKMRATVRTMKAQMEVLERHEHICRQKLANMQMRQNRVSQDAAAADLISDRPALRFSHFA